MTAADQRRLLELIISVGPKRQRGTKDATSSDADQGASHKARAAARQKKLSEANREIGPLPAIEDPKLRRRVEKSFKLFCETCFPKAFSRKWSNDHLKVIKRIEATIVTGGQFALAMPRGSGKTTLCEAAVVWALVTRRHRYVMIVGADEDKAAESLERIEAELSENDELLALFPEVCFPIQALEGIKNRCRGQVCEGTATRMKSKADRIVLPTLTAGHLQRLGIDAKGHDRDTLTGDDLVPGYVVKAAGLLSATRGVQHRLATGERIRPSLVLLDDPQTRESASSDLQNDTRHRILTADLMGMVEPGEHLDVLMPCTVIQKGDLADLMLDPIKTPDYRGIRQKMVYGWPDTTTDEGSKQWQLIEDYFAVVEECYRVGDVDSGEEDEDALDEVDFGPANRFWKKHRKQLEAGMTAAWPERYSKKRGEVSALQHAFNKYRLSPDAFWSEYQNTPMDLYEDPGEVLTVDQVAVRVSGFARYEIPLAAKTITSFIDVQKKGLYWMVVAFADDFTGWVIDYGAFPKQNRSYFKARTMSPGMNQVFRGRGFEGALVKSLAEVTTQVLTKRYVRDDGVELEVDRLLIDAAWGRVTDIVRTFIRSAKPELRRRMNPAIGKFVGPDHCPIPLYKPTKHEKIGNNWLIKVASRQKEVMPDTNWWKSFTNGRLATADGVPGACRLYGIPGKQRHDFLAQQLCSEYSKIPPGGKRPVEIWELKTGESENHWWDCLVGCHVAASIEGVQLIERPKPAGNFGPRGVDRLAA